MVATVLIFSFGLLAGLLYKGITINIVHKPVETVDNPKYNESLAGMLPPEVQHYYNQTNGTNNWK